ncbi:MAG TPA: class I SAM-dependent methyltransferase [Frankiaceae bacterium]|nr:class I SAM-dependent methyltransferase [Frankiaceae bacterium]
MTIHEDRDRAGSFGEDAELYDRARPRYPDAMVSDLLGGEAPDVLDVGCGTGIAAEAFAARGCRVLGVEPDERMAAVARRKGLDVEVSELESWDPRRRAFGLVVSGQAWHWVDPVRGPAAAARALVPGGRIALFWNIGHHDDDTQAALDAVYARHAPQLVPEAVTLRRVGREGDAEALRLSGEYEEPEVRHYPWTRRHTAAEWVAKLPTHSDHRLLPDAVREALLADVAAVIEERGGIEVRYDTLVVTALRRR